MIYGHRYPNDGVMYQMIAINGGNRMRGLMAWANAVSDAHNSGIHRAAEGRPVE